MKILNLNTNLIFCKAALKQCVLWKVQYKKKYLIWVVLIRWGSIQAILQNLNDSVHNLIQIWMIVLFSTPFDSNQLTDSI